MGKRHRKTARRSRKGTPESEFNRLLHGRSRGQQRLERQGYWRFLEGIWIFDKTTERHSEPESKHWRFYSPNPTRQIGFGLIAVACFLFQYTLPWLNEQWGGPLGSYVGYVRLGVMFIGAGFAFAAWPKWVPRDRSPEAWEAEQAEMRRAKAEFHEKTKR